jgi:germination protein M
MKVFMFAVYMTLLFLLNGCSGYIYNNNNVNKDSEKSVSEIEPEENQESSTIPIQPVLLPDIKTYNTILLKVYYQDRDGCLIPVTRRIKKQEAIARAAVTGLIDSSINREELQYFGLYPTIPEGTKIRGINIRDGVATIDFDGEFLNSISDIAEKNMITSIVYTLTQFDTVEGVKIWVNGYSDKKLKYGTDITKVLTKNNIMINTQNKITGNYGKTDVYLCKKVNERFNYIIPVSIMIPNDEYDNPLNVLATIFKSLQGINVQNEEKSFYSEIPSQAELLESSIKEGVLTLNFNEGIKGYGGSAKEEMFVDQILFSMGEIGGAKTIRMLINGKAAILPEGMEISGLLEIPRTINDVIDK